MIEQRTFGRASAQQMLGVAANLSFDFGTAANGDVVRLGRWSWFINGNGEGDLPPLPKLPADATQRQVRDDRIAAGLQMARPTFLFRALLKGRSVIERCVTYRPELLADGYTGAALARKLATEADILLPRLTDAVKVAMEAEAAVAEVRLRAAREQLKDQEDDEVMLAALGLAEAARKPAEKEIDLMTAEQRATRAAVTGVERAVFDVAVVQALKPLTGVERVLVLEERALPEQLADPRVLTALFRVPAILSPLKRDELEALARLAWAVNWPLTAKVTAQVEEMVRVVREVLSEAIFQVGLLQSDKPLEAFRQVRPGASWVLQPMAERNEAARRVREALLRDGL